MYKKYKAYRTELLAVATKKIKNLHLPQNKIVVVQDYKLHTGSPIVLGYSNYIIGLKQTDNSIYVRYALEDFSEWVVLDNAPNEVLERIALMTDILINDKWYNTNYIDLLNDFGGGYCISQHNLSINGTPIDYLVLSHDNEILLWHGNPLGTHAVEISVSNHERQRLLDELNLI